MNQESTTRFWNIFIVKVYTVSHESREDDTSLTMNMFQKRVVLS
jgi:hypothetical protein